MGTNLPSCFSVQCLAQLLKFLVNFTLLKYSLKSQRSYGYTKELIFGFRILNLKYHFSASLKVKTFREDLLNRLSDISKNPQGQIGLNSYQAWKKKGNGHNIAKQ